MVLRLIRFRWTQLAACVALPVAGIAVIPTAALADEPSPAQQLKNDYTTWQLDAVQLLRDVDTFDKSLLARYKCPPEEPNKETKRTELNELARRLNLLRVRQRGIEDRRTQLGQAGEGQLSSGVRDRIKRGLVLGTPEDLLISDADMKTVQDLLGRISTQISQLRNRLSSIPPSARECDPRTDPIRTINFNAPSQDPGTNVRATITATSASGKAVTIKTVTVNGINAIGTPGPVGGLNTANVTYDFKIDDVRRQGPFRLTVTVTGIPAGFPAGATPISQSVNVNYTVNNVAPTIESVPDNPTAKPGEPLILEGQVVVVDRNADDQNAGEINPRGVTLNGHPAGLETVPGQAFQRFSTVTQVGIRDPMTGRYVFDVKREATTKKPHAHGKFPTKIQVADQHGASDSKDIEFTVENVAPTLTLRVHEQHFHAGDGEVFEISGRVADDNGADDIEGIEIDASKAVGAGKGMFSLGNGSVVKVGQPADDGFSFRINPRSVGHTDTAGKWPINAIVRDGGAPEQGSPAPLTATANSEITVTNLPPTSNAFGYLSNLNLVPGKKDVCPRDPIRVGILVHDPENDKLKVTAIIRETGDMTVLTVEPGNSTHTGILLAPAKPGKYHIDFVIEEVKTAIVTKPNKVTYTDKLDLEVKPCGNEDENRTAPPPPPPPKPPAVAITGPPKSTVKVGPKPPPLPGNRPANLVTILEYARLMQMAGILDVIRGETAKGAKQLTFTQLVMATFWTQYLLDQQIKVMEDGGNNPDGTCGSGNGEGPVLANPNAPKGGPKQETPFNFLKRLLTEEYEKAKKAGYGSGIKIDGGDNFRIDDGGKSQPTEDWSPQVQSAFRSWVDNIKIQQGKAAPSEDYGLDPNNAWRMTDNWNLKLEGEYEKWGKGIKVAADSGILDSVPYAGFLYGLTLQEGHAEGAPQTKLDDMGQGAIRYVSPTIAGFTLRSSWGDDDYWDTALRYAGEFGNIRVAAGAGYLQSNHPEIKNPSGITSYGISNDEWALDLRYAGLPGSFRLAPRISFTYDLAGSGKAVMVPNPAAGEIIQGTPYGYGSGLSGGRGLGMYDYSFNIDQYIQSLKGQPAGGQASGGAGESAGNYYLNDNWKLNDKWSFNLGVKYDESASEGAQSGTGSTGTGGSGPSISISGGGPVHGGYLGGDAYWTQGAFSGMRGDFGAIQLGTAKTPRNYYGGVSYDPFVSTALDNPCRTKQSTMSTGEPAE